MARPVKETPILYGEEARKFELRMQNVTRLPEERRAKIFADYEFMRNRGTNCRF